MRDLTLDEMEAVSGSYSAYDIGHAIGAGLRAVGGAIADAYHWCQVSDEEFVWMT
jgi:hypothetical protein